MQILGILQFLNVYYVATGMGFNVQKSTISFNVLSEEIVAHLKAIFPFRHFDIQEGFKYVGFILKPSGYIKGDRGWLLGIGEWLTLVKAVLEVIPVGRVSW